MSKKMTLTFIFLFALAALWAHTPLLYVEDNYDGTITVEGGFSNGAAIAGLPLMILDAGDYKGPEKSINGKKLLFETKFDESGIAELVKPAVKKYIILFDGGPWKPFMTGKK